nr:hypothetical protein [uncultured Fusobacterium sp.]
MKKILLVLGLALSVSVFAAQEQPKTADKNTANVSNEKVIGVGTTLPGYVYTTSKDDLITLIRLAVANDTKNYETVMQTLVANDAGGDLRENLKVEVLENDGGLVRLRLADKSSPIQVWTVQEALK